MFTKLYMLLIFVTFAFNSSATTSILKQAAQEVLRSSRGSRMIAWPSIPRFTTGSVSVAALSLASVAMRGFSNLSPLAKLHSGFSLVTSVMSFSAWA